MILILTRLKRYLTEVRDRISGHLRGVSRRKQQHEKRTEEGLCGCSKNSKEANAAWTGSMVRDEERRSGDDIKKSLVGYDETFYFNQNFTLNKSEGLRRDP